MGMPEFLLVKSGILDSFTCGIQNATPGIRNPSDDCNPDPYSTVEDWHPEYTAWRQESKTVLNSLGDEAR